MRIEMILTDKKKFIDLLLLADEQESMIDRYLEAGDMFALYDDDVKSICVVTKEAEETYELKNIATYQKDQGKGYGKKLIEYIFEYYAGKGKIMLVGTGDSPLTLPFYEHCGFKISHRIKNFFVENYDHPIVEAGKQLIDMVYLKKFLKQKQGDGEIDKDSTGGKIKMDALREFFTAQDITDFFHEQNISFEFCQHAPAYSIDDLEALDMPHKEDIVKNLFLRDDKKKNYYLVTLPGHKKIDLKTLSEKIPSRRLSFASEDMLYEKLLLKKGHVTPLGVLNNKEKNIIVVFDKNLQGKTIGVHPMENSKTVFLRFEVLVELIENNGNPVLLCDI